MSSRGIRGASVWFWMAVLGAIALSVGLLLLVVSGIVPKASDAPRVARNGEVLGKALDRYWRERGKCPATLDELVPRYTAFIPHPGLRIDRPFVLWRRESEGDRFWTGASPYAITAGMAPAGTLVYRPSHKYDDLSGKPPGGRPVGDWYLSYVD